MIIVNTNVGTFNGDTPTRLHNTLNKIQDKHGKITVATIQENNHIIPKIKPFFNKIHSNEEFINSAENNHACNLRGVMTLSENNIETKFEDKEIRAEVVVTVHEASRKSKNGRRKRVPTAIINCYNNHHIDNETLSLDIKLAIKQLKGENINNIIVLGDFNDESFIVPGLSICICCLLYTSPSPRD